MHRFFLDPQCIRETAVTFAAAPAHQIRNVLRMEPGERVVVLDDSGVEYEVRLTDVSRQQVLGEVVAQRPCLAEPALQLTLYQALLKRDNFEWVLQKGTEIGVSRFVPLITTHTVVTAVRANKIARWQRIVTEAAEQSRRGRVPSVAAPITLAEAWPKVEAEVALMPWVSATAQTPRSALAGRQPRAVALFIGPEGGWSPAEVTAARERDVIPVTLGPRTLRAETAALVAATLVLQEIGALS